MLCCNLKEKFIELKTSNTENGRKMANCSKLGNTLKAYFRGI